LGLLSAINTNKVRDWNRKKSDKYDNIAADKKTALKEKRDLPFLRFCGLLLLLGGLVYFCFFLESFGK